MKGLPMTRCWLGALALAAMAPAAEAQQGGPPMGWVSAVDGFVSYQDDSDLDGGGSFTATRSYLRAGGLYRFESGHSAGLFVSAGQLDYDFDIPGARPWSDINDIRVSVPLRFPVGDRVSAFLVPSLRYDYESGVSASDGRTYGAFAGLTWRVSDRLTIGPGVGFFTQIEDDDANVFPALLVDWDITDRWRLSTGTGLGATQGPGISLSYAYSDALRVSFGARYEELRFRLDDTGLAPGGVGQDRSVPVVISVNYDPTPNMSLSAFAGAEFGGELQLESAAGAVVSTQDYDTAPLFGLAFRVTF
jgi:hypothetical protein